MRPPFFDFTVYGPLEIDFAREAWQQSMVQERGAPLRGKGKICPRSLS